MVLFAVFEENIFGRAFAVWAVGAPDCIFGPPFKTFNVGTFFGRKQFNFFNRPNAILSGSVQRIVPVVVEFGVGLGHFKPDFFARHRKTVITMTLINVLPAVHHEVIVPLTERSEVVVGD
ncbi:MAG: hypothetical protein FMNOHCHN_03667 [Ignavibacteriaceae bacterium]|nr:hypothetical protein [Ignavibacteriaceae bacterium]